MGKLIIYKYLIFFLIVVFPESRIFSQDASSIKIDQDSVFHIQLSASRKMIDTKTLNVNPEARDLVNVTLVGGWYKYFIGNFLSHESAQEYLNGMKTPGFIATYKNGKLIRAGANRFPNTYTPPAQKDKSSGRPLSMTTVAVLSAFPGNEIEKKPSLAAIGRKMAANSGLFTDERDGEVYRWVKVGNQQWMAENLRYSVANKNKPAQLNTVGKQYGRLYNFKSAAKDCPKGWHLPSDAEWLMLEETIGLDPQQLYSLGYREGQNAGRLLKSTELWKSEGNGYDQVGFNAYPAGMAKQDGSRRMSGERAFFWTSTHSRLSVWIRQLRNTSTGIIRGLASPDQSLSVRCVKDHE